MNFTKQVISLQLDKLIAFLEPVHMLSNSHFASIFTENLWNEHVPKSIQSELNNASSMNDFIHLYPEIIKNNCPDEFAERHPCLLSFLHNAVNISILNDNKYLKSYIELENLLSAKNYTKNCDFKEEFMSKKKLHEVKVTSKVTALLSNLTETSHIVDIGDGKGYLSSVLALHHSLKVLGLDSSQITTCGAVKRSEKVAKLWNGEMFDNNNPCQRTDKKTKEEFIKNYFKQVVTFVTPLTNIIELVKENFKEESHGITLTGLHTCGDLAPTCLEVFLNNPEVRSIVNVGCCYHHISEKFLFNGPSNGSGNENKTENFGFPMSDFLKKKKFVLGRNARMLAAHSLDRMNTNSELDDFSLTSLFYRAILETVIKNEKRNEAQEGHVGRLAKKCVNFHEYMFKALKKLDINAKITDSDLDKLYQKFQAKKSILIAFFLLRVTLAPVIESIILLDRLLYLLENGIENAYLVRLFDLEISPRGFGIIAWKDSN